MNEKIAKPPYCSYRSFDSLMNELREHEVLPAAIDRSFLSRRSGSEQSALILALRWFGFINESNVPTERLQGYIAANEEHGKELLKRSIEDAYAFISDGSINLRSATTQQMTERFRQYEISGSTLTKSVAFFLQAAKETGIQISPHIKAPQSTASGNAKRKAKPALSVPQQSAQPTPAEPHAHRSTHKAGTIVIPIPIYGMQDGAIHLPADMDERQWNSVIKMTEFILKNYRETMGAERRDSDEEEAL